MNNNWLNTKGYCINKYKGDGCITNMNNYGQKDIMNSNIQYMLGCNMNNGKVYKQNNALDNMQPYNYNDEDINNSMNMREIKNYAPEKMEPIESLCNELHKIIIDVVDEDIDKLITENMDMMPKAISKEQYKKEVEKMFNNLVKKEEISKKYIYDSNTNRVKYGENNRISCPNCGGTLKSILEIMFITQLIKRGCIFCY